MKKLATSLAAAIVTGSFLLPTYGAMGDTENCVTHAEYDRTENGLTPSDVELIYDVYGSYAGDNERGYWRQYRTCWAPGEREIIVRYSWNSGRSYDWLIRDA